eukprot:COSAG01_NODE_62_length_29700_cov_146.810615_4_plen_73_part_00
MWVRSGLNETVLCVVFWCVQVVLSYDTALDTWPHTVGLVSREAPLVYSPLSHAQPLHVGAGARARAGARAGG